MTELYDRMLAAVTEQSAFVHLDVMAPRDAPNKQLVAHLFEDSRTQQPPRRPQGQAASLAITHDQARALLRAGAKWSGPAHLQAEILDT